MRRIEITAVRRTTVIIRNQGAAEPEQSRPQQSNRQGRTRTDTAHLLEFDPARAELLPPERATSSEAAEMIEALFSSDGDIALAAAQLGLNISEFYSKLRSLAASVKREEPSTDIYLERRRS